MGGQLYGILIHSIHVHRGDVSTCRKCAYLDVNSTFLLISR